MAHGRLALELRDVRKSFGKTEIIRGANLAVRPVSAWPSSAPTARARARCST
jgi:ABC-type sugar transport system ATPase subunit